MIRYLIRELTDKGHRAIKIHVDEFKKMPIRQKMIFKTAGYKQEVISRNPFVLTLDVGNKHASNTTFLDLIKTQIIDALKENGAREGIDYEVVIENE